METILAGKNLVAILDEFRGRSGVLLAVLHRVQGEYGYIPKESIAPIAQCLGMGVSTVFGILTYYSEFRTELPPRMLVNMCLGPTCHLRGADKIKKILEVKLGIDEEGKSPDNKAGIHVVQCSGLCHMSPLLCVNGQTRGRMKVRDAAKLAQEIIDSFPNPDVGRDSSRTNP